MESILNEMTENVVEDIPGSLITCVIDGQEMKIQACSPQYVELRSADRIVRPFHSLTFAYYAGQTGVYQTVEITDMQTISIVQEKEISFSCLHEKIYYYETVLHIADTAYRELFSFVTKQYYDYIILKNESYDNTFSEVLTGYPARQDECFTGDYDSWRQERLAGKQIQELKKAVLASGTELVWNLDHDMAYQRYLSGSKEQNDTCVINYQRLYIGNQFCHNLFPDRRTLCAMLAKAQKEKKKVTIVTTYLRESLREQTFAYLDEIYEWCKTNIFPIEVIVNDWGMLEFLKAKSEFMEPVLGLLLNKRRKDPRYSYKAGVEAHLPQMACNQLNQPLFGELLRNMGIKRIEYETCGYQMKLAEFSTSGEKDQVPLTLHLPLYQTNTSQFCTLYSLCHNKDRGLQQLVNECPKYCESYICAYPEHLDMVGLYNSLFALDTQMTAEQLKQYLNQGVDRLVWNL